MKTFSTKLIAAVVISSLGFTGDVSACNGGGGGRGGVSRNGGGQGNYIQNNNNQACNSNGGYNANMYNSNISGSSFGQAYEPFHGMYTVEPGDSFYTVSLKEYGTSAAATYIARYNRVAPNAALVPGQRLALPSISANGQLTASRAPAAETFNAMPNAFTASPVNFAKSPLATVANPAAATPEPPRASVPTGSVIKLDGQSLGTQKGVVRLRISNVAMPVEVVEWSADSTKVRLPKLDVSGGTKAELEVVRADGTLAATNAIELTTAISGLASTK
jgi:hypothetical protein